MSVLEVCSKQVVYIDHEAGITEVAQMMREQHVGCVVVVDAEGKPVGMVTDRDLVVEVLAELIVPDNLTVKDIMSEQPLTVLETDEVKQALDAMRAVGVRRAPVVDQAGLLSGLLSIDDVLVELSSELSDIICLIFQEQIREGRNR